MTAPKRLALLLLAVATMMFGAALPMVAANVETPNTSFTDDYDVSTDLANYLLDRYNPGATPAYLPTFTKSTVDGRDVGVLTIDGDGPIADFYRYQGFKRTTDGTNTGVYDNGFGTCLETTFMLDSDFSSSDRFVSFWAQTNNAAADGNQWPIAGIQGNEDAGTPDHLRFWTSAATTNLANGWHDVPMPAGFDPAAWHTFTYVLTPTANVWFLDGELIWTDGASYVGDQSTIEYQIFNNINYGVDYETYIDSFTAGSCTTMVTDAITPEALGSFTGIASNTAIGGVTEAYDGASGDSGWALDTGNGDGSGLGGKSWLYTTQLDDTRLAELTEFAYSTYVDPTSAAVAHLAPAINLQVDWDDDGTRDTTLVWEPVYAVSDQGAVAKGVWQQWDALGGEWWYTTNFGSEFTNSSNQFEPLGWYVEKYPNARILETWTLPGTSFVSGQSSGGIWADFVGAVDNIVIGTANGDLVTSDIEMTTVAPGNSSGAQGVVGDDVVVDVPANLAAPNGSIWLNTLPAIDYVGVDVEVSWEVRDTGGVFDSGTAIVPGGDISVDIPITIPGSRITGASYTAEVTFTDAVNAVVGPDDMAEITVTAAPEPPLNTTLPIVDGEPGVGQIVSSTDGTWTGATPITYTYQWMRCDDTGAACVAIAGAQSDTYVTTQEDIGSTVRSEVTATNVAGDAAAISAPFGPVHPVETVALVDPSTGEWHYYDRDGVATETFYFGVPGDYPFVGDWNCDGIETPGLYRQSDGFVYLRNSNTQGVADITFFFGNPGDVPVAGDFNSDGCDTVSIYRPSEERFYIINALGTNGGGLGPADYSYIYGDPGDKPFIGDWNANGQDTPGLHRESTGFMYMRNTNTQGIADFDYYFGWPGDRVVAGDWTGNGVSTVAVFRPSDTTVYERYTNTQGNADFQFIAGETDWLPVAGRLDQ